MGSRLERLEEARRRFGPADGARTAKLIAELSRARFPDAASLARFHEALLFLRAYPASAAVARAADRALFSFSRRVEALRAAGANLAPLEEPGISGISGTAFSAVFTYDVARRLAAAHPDDIAIDWEGYEEDRLAPRLLPSIPLLAEESLVEAGVPVLEWLDAAQNAPRRDLPWLLGRLDAADYDSLALPLRWELGDCESTRSRARLGASPLFCHRSLIRRSEVSLEADQAPLPLHRLSRAEAGKVIALAAENSALRFRELYGFTYPDPRHALRAEAGRGVVFYVWGVPPERRLPLRAYHCGLIVKNGVPVGYVETLTLADRMEVGFNIYYTFREGESAWLYARLLRLFRQLMPVRYFSVHPYQVGDQNEEAIASGAFWFYRKLGFRPVEPAAARLLEREEKKIAARPGYRSGPAVLRRLAASYMIYEAPGAERGLWDRFHIRRIGLRATRAGRAAAAWVERALGAPAHNPHWTAVLSLIPDLRHWAPEEKRAALAVVESKCGPDESLHVRLAAGHARLRRELLRLGGADS